jgi:hypothetical protein
MRISKSLLIVSAFVLLTCSLPALAQSEWIVTKTVPIGGEGAERICGTLTTFSLTFEN